MNHKFKSGYTLGFYVGLFWVALVATGILFVIADQVYR